jgi:hypothetical protein
MIELKSRLMLAGAALAILAGLFSGVDAQQKGPADPPPDITGFIARRGSCSEWAQKAFDAEWTAGMDGIWSNLQSLKCFDIVDDERALRQKYASNPDIQASLGAGTWVKVVKRLPVRIAVPPDLNR